MASSFLDPTVLLDPAGSWSTAHFIGFAALVQVGFEIYVQLLPTIFGGATPLSPRGKHLDTLETLDKSFILFNRLAVIMMTYHYLMLVVYSPRVAWRLDAISAANTLLALPTCFIAYDLPYSLFHRLLHVRGLYAYVHKHHHRQIVPTRGNTDAINVHPFEFLCGEYNHLFAVWATSYLCGSIHALTTVLFVFSGGFLASLNHTRFGVRLSVPLPKALGSEVVLFDVRAHDVHHRIPQSNYGQYTMFWDKLMGSFREYEVTHPRDKKAS